MPTQNDPTTPVVMPTADSDCIAATCDGSSNGSRNRSASQTARQTTAAVSTPASSRRRRFSGDRGEGVISAAIAVLIMAFLGAAMWVGFQQMWKATEATTNDKITQIGSE